MYTFFTYTAITCSADNYTNVLIGLKPDLAKLKTSNELSTDKIKLDGILNTTHIGRS